MDAGVVQCSSPARGGGDRSAGRDRLGRVVPANAIADSCAWLLMDVWRSLKYGSFLRFLRKYSAIISEIMTKTRAETTVGDVANFDQKS